VAAAATVVAAAMVAVAATVAVAVAAAIDRAQRDSKGTERAFDQTALVS